MFPPVLGSLALADTFRVIISAGTVAIMTAVESYRVATVVGPECKFNTPTFRVVWFLNLGASSLLPLGRTQHLDPG